MLLNKALKKAKRTEGEKVGLNIKVPVGMKNDFDRVCKDNGTSMTAMMLALIETFIEESQGNFDPIEVELLRLAGLRIKELESSINYFEANVDPDYIQEYETMITERNRLQQMVEGMTYDSNY